MSREAQEAAYKAGLIRFYKGDKAIGAGLYIEKGYILTCAHVVSECLGLGKNPQEITLEAVAGKPVKVDFPFEGKVSFQNAEVVSALWRVNNQDLAVLKISAVLPEIISLAFSKSTDYGDHCYKVYGFPDKCQDGVWTQGKLIGERANGWIQMEDTKAQGIAIEPGFSGAPVWDRTAGKLAGITVARDKDREDAKIGFMIPYNAIKPALEAIALFILLPETNNLVSHWKTAYHLVLPENYAEPLATNLQEAIVQVQDMSSGNNTYGAIVQFVGYLVLPELGLIVQPSLLEWLQEQGENINALLEFMRQKTAARDAKQPETLAPHLLFWVQEELNSDRYFAQAYLIPNREQYNSATQTGVQQLTELAELFETEKDEKISQLQLEEALQICLNESVDRLTLEQDDFPPICVEVFLSRRCLSLQVDQWQADEQTLYNPQPESIGSRYKIVLRVVERLNERLCTRQMKALWGKKWSVLENNQASLAVQGLICGVNQELNTLSTAFSSNHEIVGWHCVQPPQPTAESEPCHFSIMVGAGVPVAIWLRQSLPNIEPEFARLLNSCLSDLPARVSYLRREAHHRIDKGSPHIGENIGLIWDDPKLIPPGAVQPKRLRMSI